MMGWPVPWVAAAAALQRHVTAQRAVAGRLPAGQSCRAPRPPQLRSRSAQGLSFMLLELGQSYPPVGKDRVIDGDGLATA